MNTRAFQQVYLQAFATSAGKLDTVIAVEKHIHAFLEIGLEQYPELLVISVR